MCVGGGSSRFLRHGAAVGRATQTLSENLSSHLAPYKAVAHFQSRDVVGLDPPGASATTIAGAPELTQNLPSGAANFAMAGVNGDFDTIHYRYLNAANRPSAIKHAGALTSSDLSAETLEPALMVLLGIALIAGVAWQRRQN